MRATDLGADFNVSVSEDDICRFRRGWPASGLGGLRGVTFQFEKRSGDLVDIWFKNGNAERWDGPALVALSEAAQRYGEQRLRMPRPNRR